MKKMKMTLAIAAATLMCSEAFAVHGQGGDDPIPMGEQRIEDASDLKGGQNAADSLVLESANLSLIDKIFQYIRATDRGG